MINVNKANEFVQNVLKSMPEGLKHLPKDLQKNLRSAMQMAFMEMDLVTREEFDVQKKVLERSREKLAVLEKKVTELERKK